MELESIHENAKRLMEILRLRTPPLAIKMLKNEAEIPPNAVRPLRNMGHHLDLCQAFAMSRWGGKTIAMLKEDMWCFEPVVGYGLAEPPQEFLEGENRYPFSIMTREAAKKWAHSFPRLKVGEYVGILSSPLVKCTFKPDLFITYCDPSQLTQLLIAKNCIDGEDITCRLGGHAACVYAVVPVLQNKQCVVASPCRGDRRIAMTQYNEIIFSAPIEMLREFVKALEYLEEHEWGYPWMFELKPEYELSNNYAKIGEKMGLKYNK